MLNPGGGEAEKMSVRIVLPRLPSRQRSVKKAVRSVKRYPEFKHRNDKIQYIGSDMGSHLLEKSQIL